MVKVDVDWEDQGRVMSVNDIIQQVEKICRKNGVNGLSLFGSFAKGNVAFTSDIDFVVYGCEDIVTLEQEMGQIVTLRKIDIFEYDSIENKMLLEDIKKYEKQIYYTLRFFLQ